MQTSCPAKRGSACAEQLGVRRGPRSSETSGVINLSQRERFHILREQSHRVATSNLVVGLTSINDAPDSRDFVGVDRVLDGGHGADEGIASLYAELQYSRTPPHAHRPSTIATIKVAKREARRHFTSSETQQGRSDRLSGAAIPLPPFNKSQTAGARGS